MKIFAATTAIAAIWGLEKTTRQMSWALLVVLLCLGHPPIASAADASLSVSVFAKTANADPAGVELRDGEILPLRAPYHVQVRKVEHRPLTVRAFLSNGKEKTLFSGVPPSGSHLDLPQDGGWYEAPEEPVSIKIVATQGATSTERINYAVEVGPDLGSKRLSVKPSETEKPTSLLAEFAPAGSSAQLSKQVLDYIKLASILVPSKELVLRGGPGAGIFRNAAPGVVLVVTDKGVGAGVVLNQAGQILTNWHVAEGAQHIGVMLKPPTGQTLRPTDMYEAHVKKFDEVADLAVIEMDRAPANLVVLKLADEEGIEVGSTVHAIGHPSGEYWTYTEGVVSQIWPNYEWSSEDKLHHTATVIQTQTPINPGNSGGPLLDDAGNVIGINSFSMPDKQGLNFAIDVGEIKRFLSAGGNRSAEQVSQSNPTHQPPSGCTPHTMNSFVDQKTAKLVTAVDTQCSGWPNLYLISEGADKPPEFALIDNVGDGKFDIKIVFHFNGKDNLWIFYGHRDGIASAFGYDYAGKGKPDLIVRVNAALG